MLKQDLLFDNQPRIIFQINVSQYQMPQGCIIDFYRKSLEEEEEYSLVHSYTWPGTEQAIVDNMTAVTFNGHSVLDYIWQVKVTNPNISDTQYVNLTYGYSTAYPINTDLIEVGYPYHNYGILENIQSVRWRSVLEIRYQEGSCIKIPTASYELQDGVEFQQVYWSDQTGTDIPISIYYYNDNTEVQGLTGLTLTTYGSRMAAITLMTRWSGSSIELYVSGQSLGTFTKPGEINRCVVTLG